MLSKNKLIEEKLKLALLSEVEDNCNKRNEWKDFQEINFWRFLSINYLSLNRFFTLLDVENGPESGWEKFSETLGLNLWEDRKWCHQYHNGFGPTRAALAKLTERKLQDENLTLASVLKIIEEMGRFDILVQINWQTLAENYKKFKNSGKCKDARTLFFEFNQKIQKEVLVKAESITTSSVLNKKQNHSKAPLCVLFSYANDAESFAFKMAEQLREGSPKIKIVMISDPKVKGALAIDYTNTLQKWYHQVRYFVPVLSPEYLRQIQNIVHVNGQQDISVYNRFLYRLALEQFVALGSRNLRCRPLCPSSFLEKVRENIAVEANGLFSVTWSGDSKSEVEEFRLVLTDEPML